MPQNKPYHSATSGQNIERGFTLLEAIVALVLISTAGLALFDWINNSIQSLGRIEAANARNNAIENTIEYMQSINPMERPSGTANFGAYQIDWKSDQITPTQDGSNYPQGTSLFQLALYSTTIHAKNSTDPHWFNVTLKLAGYKKTRQLTLPFQ